MERQFQNEDKRELSKPSDSITSAIGTSKQSFDRDCGETKQSHEVNRILAACAEPHNLDLVIKLATAPGGLVNDEVRKVACKSWAEQGMPRFSALTATQGHYCLATEATTPSSPALLGPGAIFQIIKMKIKSSLT